ncbi:OmpA family protein [Amylibacter sp. IMCC11727]|uniref:OmpA family protein n=1 Tax=Amylibacter sp. IMCC11727 TaxID=3039851 RepID=UPI00244DBB40|nr:OmpA family protein [Amylibacter sp. IMCC11727]WGI22858.1 OmpA family protein [Amylibacter sp. IMCC11727]
MKTLAITSAAVAALTVTACSSTDNLFSYIGPEAGHEILEDDLGVATATNVAVQTGQLNGAYVANLTRKFASEAPARINFAFNSAELDATARNILRKQAQWIKAHPQIVFRVYGHTDKVGSNAANKRLGLRRARAAVNYLVSLGVSRSKVQAVSSFGETRPLVLTEAPNRENRRTVTEVSGFARKGRASDLDGKYAKTVYDKYITTTYVIEDSKE